MLWLLFLVPVAKCCTHPGVKVLNLKAGDRLRDCSDFGLGLSTPETAHECREAILATKYFTPEELRSNFVELAHKEWNFNTCFRDDIAIGFFRGSGTRSAITSGEATFFCKCVAASVHI
jgi:hypothetical protein